MEVKVIAPADFENNLEGFEIICKDIEPQDSYQSIDPLLQQLLLGLVINLTYEISKKLAVCVKQYVSLKLTPITIQSETGNQITVDNETSEETIMQFFNE